MIVKCPQCGKECDTAGNPFRPFCCERCKLLDFGNWMSGGYRIPEAEQSELKQSEAERELWKDPDVGQPPTGKDSE